MLSKRIISFRQNVLKVYSLPYSKLLQRIADPKRAKDVALIDPTHQLSLTYEDLDHHSTALAQLIESKVSSNTIGSFNKPSISFVVSLLATWKLQKTFVPLCVTHSVGELSYFIEDSNIQMILCGSKSDVDNDTLLSLKPAIFETNPLLKQKNSNPINKSSATKQNESDDALIMYTSGTTGRPKGVVHTHDSLLHMIKGLEEAWQYTAKDKILHFLPLYHLHGMLNKLLCMLWAGGTIEFLPSAHAPVIWDRLIQETAQPQCKPVSLFMAVPTVYAKMLEHVPHISSSQRAQGVAAMKEMRLMVCGSAALPDIIMDQWYELTGQRLLERYGMTELGMALSNPYQGERRKGYVGQPLPYVHVRIVNEEGNEITTPNTPGELLVSVSLLLITITSSYYLMCLVFCWIRVRMYSENI
jgi:malonyl-CoA/methylmalonyl-CoA synthetase